jgi:TonB family protein
VRLLLYAMLALCAPSWSANPDPEPAKSAQPASAPARLTRGVDPQDYYPAEAFRRGEQGTPGVQSCVDATGKLLRDPVITTTSGFPDIDAAAIEVAKAVEYAAGTENGAPLSESCVKFKIQFKSDVPARMVRPVSPADYYPAGARRRQEQGSPVVQACVGPSGELLREPEIVETSGFPELDAAAVKVAKATRYAAGKANNTPLPESCIKFKIKFESNIPGRPRT